MSLSSFLIQKKSDETRRELNKHSRKAGRALAKQSSWAGLGRMIGSSALPALATAALGPIGWAGAAAAAGAGSYLGGKWGREGAGKTKGGKTGRLKAGPGDWGIGSRETINEDVRDMKAQMKQKNMSAALTAAATAGARELGPEGVKELFGGTKTAPQGADLAGKAAEGTTASVWSPERMWGRAPKTSGAAELTEETISAFEKVDSPFEYKSNVFGAEGTGSFKEGMLSLDKPKLEDIQGLGVTPNPLSSVGMNQGVGQASLMSPGYGGRLGGHPFSSGSSQLQIGDSWRNLNPLDVDPVKLAQSLNKGGKVRSRNPRNMLEQTTDSVPAMLTPGEFVIRKEAVDAIGIDKLKKLNKKGKIKGYQKGGKVGLDYAKDYEYNPNLIGKVLDKLPGIGGYRDWKRADEYGDIVHRNQASIDRRSNLMNRSASVEGQSSREVETINDITTKNKYSSSGLVSSTEDPRVYGLKSQLSEDDIQTRSEYVSGSEAGHSKRIGFSNYENIDPYNVAKHRRGKKVLGLFPVGFSGSVEENVGRGAYIPQSVLKGQLGEQGSISKNLEEQGYAGGGLVRGNMYNTMRRRMI